MIRTCLFALLTLAYTVCAAANATAQDRQKDTDDTVRYASLRADEVNVRAGPGVRYPVKWVFVRKRLPVAITAEFESWRKIRDSEGAVGWVHRAMLSAKRSIVVRAETRTLRRSAADSAPAVAQLTPGIVAQIERCDGLWCEVAVDTYSGWIRQSGLWGLRTKEVIE